MGTGITQPKRTGRWVLMRCALAVLACAVLLNWIVAYPGLHDDRWVWPSGSVQTGIPMMGRTTRPWPLGADPGWPDSPDSFGENESTFIARDYFHASPVLPSTGTPPWDVFHYTQAIKRFGWPWHGLWFATLVHPTQRSSSPVLPGSPRYIATLRCGIYSPLDMIGPKVIPFGIVPAAFAANTVVYAGSLGLLMALAGRIRAWRRTRRGLCAACAYPVGVSPVCTECGAPVPRR